MGANGRTQGQGPGNVAETSNGSTTSRTPEDARDEEHEPAEAGDPHEDAGGSAILTPLVEVHGRITAKEADRGVDDLAADGAAGC